MKRRKSKICLNLILVLLTLMSVMFISCSCEDFGDFSDIGGLILPPEWFPDGAEGGNSDDGYLDSTSTEPQCDHIWREESYPKGITCLDEISLDLKCTQGKCTEVKKVTARGSCDPDENGICKYCGNRATDISNFIFVRRSEKYYEVSLREECIEKTVVFPDHYLDLPVRKIASNGAKISVEQIFIPSSVSQLDDSAFRKFGNLVSVYIGEGSALKKINRNAFYGCEKLMYISLERCLNLVSIGDAAFFGCESLTAITVPAVVNSIGNYAFYGCEKLFVSATL